MHSDKLFHRKSLEDELYLLGCIFLVIGSIGAIIYFNIILQNVPSISCVLNSIFGIYCPGCGGTRAVTALLQGDWMMSLWYHPLVLYTAVIYGGFMITQTLERLHVPKIKGWKFHAWHMYGAVVILVLNFVAKNILLLCFRITI